MALVAYAMTNTVYRMQDKEGRGPWRPGFSSQWVEDKPDEVYDALPPWPAQFGIGIMKKAIVGMHFGCGCRSLNQLRKWFTPTEYAKLLGFGYQAVQMDVGRVLAESDIQCVFERAKPLREDVKPVDLYSVDQTSP